MVAAIMVVSIECNIVRRKPVMADEMDGFERRNHMSRVTYKRKNTCCVLLSSLRPASSGHSLTGDVRLAIVESYRQEDQLRGTAFARMVHGPPRRLP